MEVIGKVKLIGDVQTYGEFKKREVVITTDDQYPQMIGLELHQDKCDLINGYSVGDEVKASLNLRGKEWINPQGVAKYFNTLVIWRLEKIQGIETPSAEQFKPVAVSEEPGDLPF